MKLDFLGTRGEIEIRSQAHYRHSALAVSYGGRRVMVDAGRDWLGRLETIRPRAIVLTHAHPDHAAGLAGGAPCPVFACPETWDCLEPRRFPVDRRTLEHRRPTVIEGIRFEAFPVEHSVRAPAVGYRIRAGRTDIFYVPDLVDIHDRQLALRGCAVYVGDGASLTRPIVRRRGDRRIGHTPVRTQLGWCAEAGVPRMVVTHCGSEIVRGDPAAIESKLTAIAAEHGVEAILAYDGMEMSVDQAGGEGRWRSSSGGGGGRARW